MATLAQPNAPPLGGHHRPTAVDTELVVFPETALTGLPYRQDASPRHVDARRTGRGAAPPNVSFSVAIATAEADAASSCNTTLLIAPDGIAFWNANPRKTVPTVRPSRRTATMPLPWNGPGRPGSLAITLSSRKRLGIG